MSSRPTHRAFSLIEAVACIVTLSIAVPACMFPLRDAAAARVDALQVERAAALMAALTDTILADAASADGALGFGAFANSNLYLHSARAGLHRRIQPITDVYAEHGLTYSVSIGPLVSATGVATGDPDRDVYRWIGLAARWRTSKGTDAELASGVMVCAP
ncbi:MAG: hypothetical protein IBJ10_07165 [Phycisphaerales bacterium]|nr:hypothetical protein [Phycisphaerales bacterium]